MHNLSENDVCYTYTQYDDCHKSNDIVIGLENLTLKKSIHVPIYRENIEEIFLSDELMEKSVSLNYLYNFVGPLDSGDGFSKRTFYEDKHDFTEKIWEIRERNDIYLEVDDSRHINIIQRIYNFLSFIRKICENETTKDNVNIDVGNIWYNSFDYVDDHENIFKWYSVIKIDR